MYPITQICIECKKCLQKVKYSIDKKLEVLFVLIESICQRVITQIQGLQYIIKLPNINHQLPPKKIYRIDILSLMQ